jgi:ribonuclease HII
VAAKRSRRVDDAPPTAREDQAIPEPLAIERGFWSRGVRRLAGLDEVGRGSLAGPVVAATVILPPDLWIDGVDDSKRLTPEVRRELVEVILGHALAIGIGAASPREIDRFNIRGATAIAMRRAVGRLALPPEHLIVDGLPVPELGADAHTAVVDGDRCVHCIACASILAKVLRDRLMERMAPRYDAYGWDRNKGYGTPEHLDALQRLGPTAHHRYSFAPVSQLTLGW